MSAKRIGCVALSRATRRLRPGRRIARLYQTETDCSPSRPPGRARPPQRGRAPRRSDHETKKKRGRTPPRGAARHAPSVNASRQNLRERSLQVSAPRATAGGVHEEKNASAHFRCLLTAPASLNIEPPPKMPSILPTVRPLFKPFFLRPQALVFFRSRTGTVFKHHELGQRPSKTAAPCKHERQCDCSRTLANHCRQRKLKNAQRVT